MVILMRKIFISDNYWMRWAGLICIVLMVIGPWTSFINLAVGSGLAVTSIIGIGTYIEFLPFFQKNLGYRLLGCLFFLLIVLIAVIYFVAVFMFLKI